MIHDALFHFLFLNSGETGISFPVSELNIFWKDKSTNNFFSEIVIRPTPHLEKNPSHSLKNKKKKKNRKNEKAGEKNA